MTEVSGNWLGTILQGVGSVQKKGIREEFHVRNDVVELDRGGGSK